MHTSIPHSPAERSYILTSLLLPQPIRTDGRSLHSFRPFTLSTGVVPQANGSARFKQGSDGGGGSEVVVGIRLEVAESGSKGGVVVEVDCSSMAYTSLDQKSIEALSTHYTNLFTSTYSPLLPALPITPSLSFTYSIDVLILSTSTTSPTSLLTPISIAIVSALNDLRIPRTRNVSYTTAAVESVDEGDLDKFGIKSVVKKGKKVPRGGYGNSKGSEFEVLDFWDEGDCLPEATLSGLPVGITLNLLENGTHFLDATPQESTSSPTCLTIFLDSNKQLTSTHFEGDSELSLVELKALFAAGKIYAAQLHQSLQTILANPKTREVGGMSGGLGFFH